MIKKIAWILDPVADNKTNLKKQLAYLNSLLIKTDYKLIPFFVLSPAHFRFEPIFFGQVKDSLKQKSAELLSNITSSLDSKNICNPIIVDSKASSIRKSAKDLLISLKKNKIDLAIVNSSSRSKAAKFIFGSFSNTLIHKSDIPTLIMNPESKLPETIKNVMFMTDLEAGSSKALKDVANFCKLSGASLHLYNKVDFMLPVTEELFIDGSQYRKQLEKSLASRKKEMNKLIKNKYLNNVKVVEKVDDKPLLFGDAVSEYIQANKIDLVVVCSKTSAKKSFLLGSSSKAVLDVSPVSVWLYHL